MTTDDADIAAGRLALTNHKQSVDDQHTLPSSSLEATTSNNGYNVFHTDHHHQYHNAPPALQEAYPYHTPPPASQSNRHHHPLMHASSSVATLSSLDTAPTSVGTLNSINTDKGHPTDLEFFEDLITEPVLVLGVDISHLSSASQFAVCATGLFCFSLLYGYLQELLSVNLCSRKLGLFLALTQFAGYTILAFFMRQFVYRKQQVYKQAAVAAAAASAAALEVSGGGNESVASASKAKPLFDAKHVPLALYLGLSLLRAIDLAMVRSSRVFIALFAAVVMVAKHIDALFEWLLEYHRKIHQPVSRHAFVQLCADVHVIDQSGHAVYQLPRQDSHEEQSCRLYHALWRVDSTQGLQDHRLCHCHCHGGGFGHVYACRCQ
jgi:hypothetical protein